MATGEIIAELDNSNQSRLDITIYGLHKSIRYGAIIDTGYTGGLVIPLITAVDIGLTKAGVATITLASGESSLLPTFLASVSIAGERQDAVVLVMGNEVLIGMDLLSKYRLCINAGSGSIDTIVDEGATQYNEFVNNLRKLSGAI